MRRYCKKLINKKLIPDILEWQEMSFDFFLGGGGASRPPDSSADSVSPSVDLLHGYSLDISSVITWVWFKAEAMFAWLVHGHCPQPTCKRCGFPTALKAAPPSAAPDDVSASWPLRPAAALLGRFRGATSKLWLLSRWPLSAHGTCFLKKGCWHSAVITVTHC